MVWGVHCVFVDPQGICLGVVLALSTRRGLEPAVKNSIKHYD